MSVGKPETINGRWDILYRDYPEVYEAWGQIEMKPDIIATLNDHFHFARKRIADIGSGTGASTIRLAKYADSVVGIEIEEAMNAIALNKAQATEIRNVQFGLGDAEHIPLQDCSVDVAIAVTIAGGDICRVAHEMERIAKPEGLVMRIDVAPGWYGGEQTRQSQVIRGMSRCRRDRATRSSLCWAIVFWMFSFIRTMGQWSRQLRPTASSMAKQRLTTSGPIV